MVDVGEDEGGLVVWESLVEEEMKVVGVDGGGMVKVVNDDGMDGGRDFVVEKGGVWVGD